MLNYTVSKWLWISLFIFLLDQLTKWIISENLALYQSIPIIPFFSLTLLHNAGAAFSFLSDAGGWQRWLLIAVAIGVGALLLVSLYKTPKTDRLLAVAISLILGGALGNLYDRVVLGYVIDFFDFYYGMYHFPAFNIADSAISIGAFLMFIDLFRPETHEN